MWPAVTLDNKFLLPFFTFKKTKFLTKSYRARSIRSWLNPEFESLVHLYQKPERDFDRWIKIVWHLFQTNIIG